MMVDKSQRIIPRYCVALLHILGVESIEPIFRVVDIQDICTFSDKVVNKPGIKLYCADYLSCLHYVNFYFR